MSKNNTEQKVRQTDRFPKLTAATRKGYRCSTRHPISEIILKYLRLFIFTKGSNYCKHICIEGAFLCHATHPFAEKMYGLRELERVAQQVQQHMTRTVWKTSQLLYKYHIFLYPKSRFAYALFDNIFWDFDQTQILLNIFNNVILIFDFIAKLQKYYFYNQSFYFF